MRPTTVQTVETVSAVHEVHRMVSNLKAQTPSLNDTLAMRRQAQQLLDRLTADLAFVEQRLADTGKRDAMRAVTGQTALEGAISAARQMICHLDSVLADMGHVDKAAEPVEVPAVQFPSRRILKPQIRHAAARLKSIPIPMPVLTMPGRAVVTR